MSRPGTSGTVGRGGSPPYRSNSPPWVPPGVLPLSPPKPYATPLTGTKRNKAVDGMHVFLANPRLPAADPSNCCWMYAAFDFKAQIPYAQAVRTVTRLVDRVVERMMQFNPAAPPMAFDLSPEFQALPQAARDNYFLHNSPTNGPMSTKAGQRLSGGLNDHQLPAPSAMNNPRANRGAPFVKGHLIFDVISTRKHIGPTPTQGPPYRLGQEIYRYVESTYGQYVVTTFVGMTDNPARRVGRDMYYSTSEDLSRSQIDFTFVDNRHMFVVFPETNSLRVPFPESMLTMQKRQLDAEEAANAEAEAERMRAIKEAEARRPPFVVPSPRL